MKILVNWFNTFILLFIFSVLMFFLFWPFIIIGDSMQNTLQNHDRICASRLLSKFDLKRGDIIICKHGGKIIIKRIIALPSEKLSIKNNLVYINEKILNEPYVRGTTTNDIDIILNADEYFIMGDNRNFSVDSRIFAPIKKSDIVAKALFKFFHKLESINYNWEDN